MRQSGPSLAELDLCTRCGLCEQACPTYRLLGFEPDSPRGRVFLMKQVAEGKAHVDEHLAEHLYTCLGCRACETVCPAGVPFGRLLEYGRYQVEQTHALPGRKGWRIFRRLAFEQVLRRRVLFWLLMLPARVLQLIPGFSNLLSYMPMPKRMRRLLRMLPPAGSSQNLHRRYSADPPKRATVGLFSGCVMDALFTGTNAATARVLARNGCDVWVAPGQWCCGALNVHAGEREHAERMARQNIDAFSASEIDAIIVNSAGCGAVLKEYGELLKDDPAYASRAQHFAEKVKDVSEFLDALGLRAGLGPLPLRVTYQDACHLAHGQRIRHQPRELLRAIPELEYGEMRHADRCCGAAGVYNLTHPELSQSVLEEKLESVADSGAHIIATTNPGCYMQLQAGVNERRMPIRVCHVIDLLDQAYAAGARGRKHSKT